MCSIHPEQCRKMFLMMTIFNNVPLSDEDELSGNFSPFPSVTCCDATISHTAFLYHCREFKVVKVFARLDVRISAVI